MLHRYVHYVWFSVWSSEERDLNVHSPRCEKMFTLGFIKNTLIATTSTTPRSLQKSIFFHFSTTAFITPRWREKITFSPIANCYHVHYVVIRQKKYFPYSYYVHYAVIFKKLYVFISALRLLNLDHDKKKYFFFISALHSLRLDHDWKHIYFHFNNKFPTRQVQWFYKIRTGYSIFRNFTAVLNSIFVSSGSWVFL